MKEKIDLPKDLQIMKPKIFKKMEWVYDPAPWVMKELFGKKMAVLVLQEQFKLRARMAKLEAEYLETIAKRLG